MGRRKGNVEIAGKSKQSELIAPGRTGLTLGTSQLGNPFVALILHASESLVEPTEAWVTPELKT